MSALHWYKMSGETQRSCSWIIFQATHMEHVNKLTLNRVLLTSQTSFFLKACVNDPLSSKLNTAHQIFKQTFKHFEWLFANMWAPEKEPWFMLQRFCLQSIMHFLFIYHHMYRQRGRAKVEQLGLNHLHQQDCFCKTFGWKDAGWMDGISWLFQCLQQKQVHRLNYKLYIDHTCLASWEYHHMRWASTTQ